MLAFFKKCNKKIYDCSSPRDSSISTEEIHASDYQKYYY